MRVSKKQSKPAQGQSSKAAEKKPAAAASSSPARTEAPRRAATARSSASADGFEAPASGRGRRAGILGDPQPVPTAPTPALAEPAPADATHVALAKVFVDVAPSGAPLVNLSANGGEGPVHFSAVQQIDPDTHTLVVIVDAYRLPGEARTGQLQTLDVAVPLPDSRHQWLVSVRSPNGAILGNTQWCPPPLPKVTALSEAAPEGSTHLDAGPLKMEMSPYRLGTLEISGSNPKGPVRYAAASQVDEANHKVVVVLDAYRRPGEEASDSAEEFDLSVPIETPQDGKEWAVEVRDATPEAKVLGTCAYKAQLVLPKLTELSTEPVPADATHGTLYYPSVTAGEPNDPSLHVRGDASSGPWKMSATTVADPATRTLTVTLDAWRAAGEASGGVGQNYDLKVPLPVTDDGKSWKVFVMGQDGRKLLTDDRFWPPDEPFECPPAVNPAKDLADATTAVPEKTDGSGNLVVWAREDQTASAGATVKVGLPGGLLVNPEGLWTSRIHVSGQAPLATAEGQAPFAAEGATVTSDGFDQVSALWAVNQALAHLRSVGVDLDKLQASKIGNGGLTRVLVNGTDEDNAWYSGTENTLTFGTARGQFHYAADQDVVVHEFGHYTLDHLNPNMWTGEGPSIHEGFGDAMAALTFGNAKMVEDAVKMPDDPYMPEYTAKLKQQGFLRTVENDKKLDRANPWEECHDRGEVYGGYFWSLRGALAGIVGDEAKANELLYGIVAKHGFFYTSAANLKSEDFVQAMVLSARAHLAEKTSADGASPVSAEAAGKIEAALIAEAQRRNLVLADWKPPEATPPLAEKVAEEIVQQQATTPSTPASETLPTALKAALGWAGRKDVELVPVAEQELGRLDKQIFRVCVRDSEGALLPVEDGHVAVIMDGSKVKQVGGGGTRLPEKLDLRPLPAVKDPLAEVREPLKKLLRGNTVTNSHFREMVLGRLDEALDPATAKTSEVIYGGKRALKLSTKFGDFLFDPRAGTVTPNRLAFVA